MTKNENADIREIGSQTVRAFLKGEIRATIQHIPTAEKLETMNPVIADGILAQHQETLSGSVDRIKEDMPLRKEVEEALARISELRKALVVDKTPQRQPFAPRGLAAMAEASEALKAAAEFNSKRSLPPRKSEEKKIKRLFRELQRPQEGDKDEYFFAIAYNFQKAMNLLDYAIHAMDKTHGLIVSEVELGEDRSLMLRILGEAFADLDGVHERLSSLANWK